jgi:hypothetical protein
MDRPHGGGIVSEYFYDRYYSLFATSGFAYEGIRKT